MDFTKIRNYLFLGLLLLVTVAFLYLIKPFAYPMFWAAVLATIFYPLYHRLNLLIKQPSLSTLITLAVVAVIIIVPLLILGTILLTESVDIYTSLNTSGGEWHESLKQFTYFLHHNAFMVRAHVDDGFITEKINEASRYVVDFLFNAAKNLTQNSLAFLLQLLVVFYTLFFFLRDGKKLLRKLMYLCPLGDRYEIMLYKKFTTTASATIRGTLAIGAIQGTLGGLLFTITGIHGALIWGIVMAILSVIPATGSFLVWLPAGIIMLALGHVWQGITILSVGVLVISVTDNLLRPVLVGKGLQIHPVLILFSTLGGLVLFGISGFVIGPIIAALFLSFWEMYEEYYHKELAHN